MALAAFLISFAAILSVSVAQMQRKHGCRSCAGIRHHADMDVGTTMELILGQKTITVTISGLFDALKTANGHGTLAMDSVALFAPEELFCELHPEIESFDYSWSIVSDPKKAGFVESFLF